MSAVSERPWTLPSTVSKRSRCQHCGGAIAYRAGDDFNGWAYWRHAYNGSVWCFLSQEDGTTQATVDPAHLEGVA